MVIEEHSEQKKRNPCTHYTEKEMSLVCLVCPTHSGIKPQWLDIWNLGRNRGEKIRETVWQRSASTH